MGKVLAGIAALFTVVEVGWLVSRFTTDPPAAGSTLSNGLGIAGLACMVAMLLYSVARRSRKLRQTARLASWLNLHIFLGVQGWMLIIFHSWGFIFVAPGVERSWTEVGRISFALMNIVFFSGLLGRYLFARLPRTLAGQHMTRREYDAECAELDKGIPADVAALWSGGNDWGRATAKLAETRGVPTMALYRAKRRIELGRKQNKLERHWRTFSTWIVAHRPLASIMYILAAVHGLKPLVGFSVAMVLAALGLVAVAVIWSLVAGVKQKKSEAKARADYAMATSRGALPPSLHPKIDLDVCSGTGACATVCPEKDVIAVLDGKARVVNPTNCIGHGECMAACPVDAIRLVIGSDRRGVDIPVVAGDFQTNVPGLFIVGELGGMGLIYNAVTQGVQCVRGFAKGVPAASEGVHQVLVVGAGPAGLASTLACMEADLDVVCLDQEDAGGTILQYPRRKIVMTRPFELPIYGRVMLNEVSKESLLELWERVMAQTGLSVRAKVKVESMARDDDGVFVVQTSAGEIKAHRVVLAIGRRGTPRKLGVPGEDGANVAYRLLEPENYANTRCLVVGGGDAAVEAAMSLGDAGATAVRLSYRRDSFGRIKPKNQERLDAAVAAGTVELVMSSTAKEIRSDGVTMDVSGEPQELDNDYVFVFAGGVLPTKFLEASGVEVRTFKGEEFAPANV